ncbi:hypothetical protein E4T43_07455 [Aureobasidium subglaciale]|nr:hypothetical protein E4T43_07455 [Aureobasidium subglaciale]
MASEAPLKRKRSVEDLPHVEPKRVLRPRSAPEIIIPVQAAPIMKARVKKTIAKRSKPAAVRSTDSSPGSNLLLQKDKIIEELRLELAEANSKLTKAEKKLAESEKELAAMKEPATTDTPIQR